MKKCIKECTCDGVVYWEVPEARITKQKRFNTNPKCPIHGKGYTQCGGNMNDDVIIYCPSCGEESNIKYNNFVLSPNRIDITCPKCKTHFEVKIEFYEK